MNIPGRNRSNGANMPMQKIQYWNAVRKIIPATKAIANDTEQRNRYSMKMLVEQLLLRLVFLIGRFSQTRLRSGDLGSDDCGILTT